MDKYEPIKVVTRKQRYGDGYELQWAEAPTQEATLVIDLVERWGMVAGVIDGEDSAGRSKLRLATPDELADRAMATAEAVFRRIRAAGWMVPLPLPAADLADVKVAGE